jgi:hypothetical protein
MDRHPGSDLLTDNNKFMIRAFIFWVLTIGFWLPFQAQDTLRSSLAEYDLFAEEEPLEVSLEFDYKNFIRRKYKDEYQPALITVHLNDSLQVSDTIRIKARGEFRKRYCNFPPIRLNFKKADFEVPALSQLEKVKLVTHCKASVTFEQYLIKEYLTYKSYNLLTDKSFRVRLVHMTYVDSKGKKKPIDKMGFVIEEVEKVAARNKCIEFEAENVHPELTNREQMTLIALFQYMIGNTDWHVPSLHNVRLIKNLDFTSDQVYAVPYDFDYCGLVDAVYAIPGPQLAIESVRDRFYMGFERGPEELQKTIALFLEQEEAIYALFENSPYLGEREKASSVKYLKEYFDIIRDEKRLRFYIVSQALQK